MPTAFNHQLLTRVRLDLGMTQDEAAAAVEVDVRTYRRYESGEVNDPEAGFSVRHPSRRRILQRFARELGIAEEELLIPSPSSPARPAPALGDAAWMACYAHALPRARHFVGRAAVLELLRAWCEDPDPERRVIAVIALGGAGKTSAVERFLADRGDGPHAGGVFVWSFYDDPRVESFLEQALAYFARGGDRPAPGERLDALSTALRGGPHLVVLDGLEVVQGTGGAGSTYGRIEDGALRRLLASAARGLGRARVLVTSRFELADLAAWEGSRLLTLRLGALSEAEGLDLFAKWGLGGGREDLAPLLDRVGRHALSVAMVGSYAGAFLGGDPALLRAFDLEPLARDDVQARRLSAVLSDYARALSTEERDLLARISLFPAGVELEVLEVIARAGGAVAGSLAGLDRSRLLPLCAKLERLGLAFAASGGERYATHPFLGEYFQSLLGVPAREIHAVERGRLAARLDVHRVGPTEATLLDAYETLLLHTLRAGHAEEAAAIYLRSLGGFAHLGLRLGEMSRGARVLRAFAEGGDPARMAPELAPLWRVRLAYDLGLYTGALGDLALAARCYRAQLDLARAAGSLTALSTGLRTLAYTERLEGALADALALTRAAADVARSAELGGDLVRAVALEASILHDLGRVTEAEEGFAEVRRLGDEPFARRGLWEAEHALDLGRLDAARALTEQNLAVCAVLGWEGHVAHGRTVSGLLALRGEAVDTAAARRHLDAARRWTASTGEVEVVLRCCELEARLALAEGRPEVGAAVARQGLELSETAGFALFAIRFANLAVESALVASPPGEALERGRAALAAARGRPAYAWGLAEALHLAGLAAEGTGLCTEAALCLREAVSLREGIQHPGAVRSREALVRLGDESPTSTSSPLL